MGSNLYKAHEQWRNRPADERFESLDALAKATKKFHDTTAISDIDLREVRVKPVSDDRLAVVGKTGTQCRLTNWSFKQLCSNVNAPGQYIATLPLELAAQCLNHGFGSRLKPYLAEAPKRELLLGECGDGHYTLRAIRSERYTPVWNYWVAEQLQRLTTAGWRVPPARPSQANAPGSRQATKEDILKKSSKHDLGIKEGDWISPAGLYASDRDMFAFMVNEEYSIDDGTPDGLARGFFVENSEVGASSFRITAFLYRWTCGNHIVWDASGVQEIAIRHVGHADDRAYEELQIKLKKYAQTSAKEMEATIRCAKTQLLGPDPESIVAALFKSIKGLTQASIMAAYNLAAENDKTDGDPRSVWGLTQGLTRYSQRLATASERAEIDAAAGQVLALAEA